MAGSALCRTTINSALLHTLASVDHAASPGGPPTGSGPTGRLLDGRYLVGRRVAGGGMAEVFEGTDTRLERRVALKLMHRSMAQDPDFVERFEREARSAAALNHPNAVAVHDQGSDAGEIYLVMEFVDGSTLRDLLRARGRLSIGEALDVLEPVLDALAAAHATGLVHRDIKPENILITRDGRVKVADFGLARAASGASAATRGVVIGTVAYLSPEQVQGAAGDRASDVYSTGVVLFEMLTGAPPFSGDTPTVVAVRHVNESVPPPSSIAGELPSAIDALVLSATDKDPQSRYRDATGFLAAVRATRQRLGLSALAPVPFTGQPDNYDTIVLSADGQANSGATATSVLEPPPGTMPPADTTTSGGARTRAEHGGGNRPPRERSDNPRPLSARVRRRRGVLALLLVVLVTVAAGAGAWAFGRGPRADIPDVAGQTKERAKTAVATAGFTAAFTDDAFSETVTKGLVIGTEPSIGTSARQGSTVLITVSKGPERYTIPNLSGRTPTDAATALEEVNLVAGTQSQAYSSTVGKGLVAATIPKAGTAVKKGTEVALVISQGPELLPVPSVVGKTSSVAQATITKAGFTPKVSLAYSTTVTKGTVVSQSPSSGKAARDSTITLVVSNGPPPVTVPNVVRLPLNTAISRLRAAGLNPVVRTNIPGGADIVVQQSVAAGSRAPRGSTVYLDAF